MKHCQPFHSLTAKASRKKLFALHNLLSQFARTLTESEISWLKESGTKFDALLTLNDDLTADLACERKAKDQTL